MKNLYAILFVVFIVSCQTKNNQGEIKTVHSSSPTIEHELELIEQTRNSFQAAFNEKRYGDLNQYIMSGFKGVPPGSEDWMEYNRLSKNPSGKFSIDSIRMIPQETSVVSDSIAYDFGTSSVYYTNADGQPIELKNTFLTILKKDKTNGKWKLFRDVSSSVVE